jgi:hypothetical protein
MSRQFEHVWQYGLQCDWPGCKATLWRVGGTEAQASNKAQLEAKAAGWSVAKDRGVKNADYCMEHANARAGGMSW